jgi:soluble P-type ATPase
MIAQTIPGFGALRLQHLVLDFNGTLALDGRLLPGVRPRLRALAGLLELHVVTADTFGTARRALGDLPCKLVVLRAAGQDRAKARYVHALGARATVAIGNGRNDRGMLRASRLGIAVVQSEGASSEALHAADIIVSSVLDALDLLLRPQRMLASLRT